MRFAHANVDRRRWHTFETFAFARGGRKAEAEAAEAASAEAARMIMTSAEASKVHMVMVPCVQWIFCVVLIMCVNWFLKSYKRFVSDFRLRLRWKGIFDTAAL